MLPQPSSASGDSSRAALSSGTTGKGRARAPWASRIPGGAFRIDDLAKGDLVFCATGVTDGWLLRGVHRDGGRISTETLVMSPGTVRVVATDRAIAEENQDG